MTFSACTSARAQKNGCGGPSCKKLISSGLTTSRALDRQDVTTGQHGQPGVGECGDHVQAVGDRHLVPITLQDQGFGGDAAE